MESSSKQSRYRKHKNGRNNNKSKDQKSKLKKAQQIWKKKENTETRNWLDLSPDLTAMILMKLDAIEILETAQKVCSSWRKICKEPVMWKSIDFRNLGDLFDIPYDLEAMARHAIDRSCGQLVDINIEYFGTDDLLQYIADRSPQLTNLRLVQCYDVSDEGLSQAVSKLPLLTNIDLTLSNFSKRAIEGVGHGCPQLKSFKFNSLARTDFAVVFDDDENYFDEDAHAIAANMPGLHHLMLLGNTLTNGGLKAILDGCSHLVSLDLRCCYNINLADDLGKRCTEQIKNLRRPNDSTFDYPMQTGQYNASDYGSYDGDDVDWFADLDWFADMDIVDYGEASPISDGSDVSEYDNFFYPY